MNIATWLVAGALTAWFAFSFLKFNVRLGFSWSLTIGACGGLIGGVFLGPLLGATTVNPGDFHPLAVFSAAATGLACLIVSDMIQRRFGA